MTAVRQYTNAILCAMNVKL